MPTLEEAVAEAAARHLAGGGEDVLPGADHRLRVARERWREGARMAGYLAGRYPEVVAPGASLLDLGCGNGGFALPFAERRSEEHTSALQSPCDLGWRPLLETTNCRRAESGGRAPGARAALSP